MIKCISNIDNIYRHTGFKITLTSIYCVLEDIHGEILDNHHIKLNVTSKKNNLP